MPTTKAEFVTVASDLFTEFADFIQQAVFSVPGSQDPVTGATQPATTETVGVIREDYDARQIDGQQIQRNDFKLLARVSQFSAVTPRTDGVTVTVDGLACQIVTAEKDAANAVWTIQVRKL